MSKQELRLEKWAGQKSPFCKKFINWLFKRYPHREHLEDFKAFHLRNYTLYCTFLTIANVKRKNGYKISIRNIADNLRSKEGVSMKNSMLVFYSHLIMACEPEFKDYFEVSDCKNWRRL